MTDDGYDEIVREFYGIDPLTRRVDNVAISRSGKLSHWTERKGYVFHLMNGGDERSEIAKVVGLVELVEVHPRTPNNKQLKVFLDLQEKALKL